MSKVEWIECYQVRGHHLEGWAVVHIDSRGFLGVVSDHGNYAFHWTSFGGDFKAFLVGLDWHYLHKKLTFGSSEVYDGPASADAIRREILTDRRQGRLDEHAARHEWDNFVWHRDEILDSDAGFSAWARDTDLVDAFEFRHSRPEPQCEAFCKKIWPHFIEKLQAGGRCNVEPSGLAAHRQAALGELLALWSEGNANAAVLLEQAFDRAVAFMQTSPLPQPGA